MNIRIRYKDLFRQVSEDLGIPLRTVEFSYGSFWKFIRDILVSIDLEKEYTKEEFGTLRTCFSIPHLGKLACTYEGYLKRRRYNERIRKIHNDKHKESKASVHEDSDNDEQI